MTNHYCGRGYDTSVIREGEDLSKSGFYANLFPMKSQYYSMVDQLQKTIDVTNEIISSLDAGKTNEEKANLKSDKILQTMR